jgi:hypothetical protein
MKMRSPFFALIAVYLLFCGLLSAQQPESIQFLYPGPGSDHVSSRTSILLRFRNIAPEEISNRSGCIQVRGELSGAHSGRIEIFSDQKTLGFKPDQNFTSGETVHVTIHPRVGDGDPVMTPFGFEFTVKQNQRSIPDNETVENQEQNAPLPFHGINPGQFRAKRKSASITDVSVPSDFPSPNLYVTTNNNPADGFIYMNYRYGQAYNVILDTSGTPVWYSRTWDHERDFKVQKNDMLSVMIRGGFGRPQTDTRANWGFISFDQNFTAVTDTFRAEWGYDTDEHELQIFEDGSSYLIGIISETVDMSQYVDGGRTNARVDESMIQGFSPEGEPVFAWAAWDHFDIRDLELDNLMGGTIRFPHMNAIARDEDGHILLSSRHLSEITKINIHTGEIIWRLGGAHNQFTFINDPLNGFRNQHDIRAIGNERYTLFDNGNGHIPPQTRAVEYELDTLAMTATLRWQYQNPYGGYSDIMGNVQRLSNGNTLINWADEGLPKATEVTPDGQLAFELWLDGYETYRAFKFPWNGLSPVPCLVAESHEEAVALFINKFGDLDVTRFRIYGGTSPNPTQLIATSESTVAALTDLESPQTWYFRTTAVNGAGQESGYSNEEEVFVSFTAPGQNMVLNGDFSHSRNHWYYNVFGGAVANWLIEGDVSHFSISSGGEYTSYIQLVQLGMELIRGENYIFEFDAWADAPRTIEASILEYGDDYTNFGQINPTYITPVHQHFSYPFTMQDQSHFNSLVVFLLGTSDIDVYLDNVSFKHDLNPQAVEPEVQREADFQLLGNYPNPFNSRTTIRFETGRPTHVTIRLYDVLGRLQSAVCNRPFDVGKHQVFVDGSGLGSGVYFYTIEAGDPDRPARIKLSSKILLVK